MAVRFHPLTTVGVILVTATLAGGCSMFSFGRGEPRGAPPEPLAAAPTGTVTGAPLPPPGEAAPPPQPSGLAALDPSLQTASVQPVPPPIGSDQLGRTDLLGGWTISTASDSCQLFMTLTTWAGGYRASTRNCTSASLQTVSAWNMEGSQVQLLNDAGTTVARLYPSSKTQFSGQTEGGGPITVSR
jgi:Protease inhibitor Inh